MTSRTLDQLYREHHAAVLTTIRRRVRHLSDDQLEDALMDTWTTLARRPDDYIKLSDPRAVRAYVATCATRTAWQLARAEQQLVTIDQQDDDGRTPIVDTLTRRSDDTEANALARIELDQALDAAATLTAGDQRGVMAALLGLSYHQEQACTGLSYTNVNRHRTEGRAKLRAQMGA